MITPATIALYLLPAAVVTAAFLKMKECETRHIVAGASALLACASPAFTATGFMGFHGFGALMLEAALLGMLFSQFLPQLQEDTAGGLRLRIFSLAACAFYAYCFFLLSVLAGDAGGIRG